MQISDERCDAARPRQAPAGADGRRTQSQGLRNYANTNAPYQHQRSGGRKHTAPLEYNMCAPAVMLPWVQLK